MAANFPFNGFLSHSAKNQAVMVPLAERLRADGAKETSWSRFRDTMNKERCFLPLWLDDVGRVSFTRY